MDHAIKHTPPAGSFAELLLATINPVTGAPYQGRLRAESSALFSAGADTTAHTITWALYAPNADLLCKVLQPCHDTAAARTGHLSCSPSLALAHSARIHVGIAVDCWLAAICPELRYH